MTKIKSELMAAAQSQGADLHPSMMVAGSPDNYVEFTDPSIQDGAVIDCIDPRQRANQVEKHGRMLVTRRTPSGGVGLLEGQSLVRTALTGNVVLLEDSLAAQEAGRLVVPEVVGVHGQNCKRLQYRTEILEKIARPSAWSRATAEWWVDDIYAPATGVDAQKLLDGLNDVSAAAVDYLAHMKARPQVQASQEAIVTRTDSLHPDHSNVAQMIDGPTAEAYLTVHHPSLSLDPVAPHEGGAPMYVDTPGAIAESMKQWGMSAREYSLSVGALLLNTIGTQEALEGLHPLHYYEASQTPRGTLHLYTRR